MANLILFPPYPGDKLAQLPGINDELWARGCTARDLIKVETGMIHEVVSGRRNLDEQQHWWDCYQAKKNTGHCPCSSCNLAAYPNGNAPHVLGNAIDYSNNPRDYRRSREIFYDHGIIFPIYGPQTEPWHAQLDPNRASLPDHPVLIPVKQRTLMPAQCEIDGWVIAAKMQFPTIVSFQFTSHDAGNLNLVPWTNSRERGLPELPFWCASAMPWRTGDGRFAITAYSADETMAVSMFQKEGTSGPPHFWEPTWYPSA